MTLSVGGLATGLETDELVSKLVATKSATLTSYNNQIIQKQAVEAQFTALEPLISSFEAASAALSDSVINKPSVTQDNLDLASISVSSDSVDGSHDLVIKQLARAARVASQGYDDSLTDTIATADGTFTVKAGASGAEVSVSVDSTTTLDDLVLAINAQDGDVQASIISDGSAYKADRLVLTSKITGTDADIIIGGTATTNLNFSSTVIEDPFADLDNTGDFAGTTTIGASSYTGTSGGTFIMEVVTAGALGVAEFKWSSDGGMTWSTDGGGAASLTNKNGNDISLGDGIKINFGTDDLTGTMAVGDKVYIDVNTPQLQEAKDAVFTLDGLTQTRSSNTITDALEGTTIKLTKVDADETIKFSVERSDAAIQNSLDNFIDAYNEVVDFIDSKQTYDTDTNASGILFGDLTANTIIQRMRNGLVTEASEISENASYRTMADLGISTDSETGKIDIDNLKLTEALSNKRSEVIDVLSSGSKTSNAQVSISLKPATVKAGSYAVSVTNAATRATNNATAAMSTLTADEVLSITYSNDAAEDVPTAETFEVALTSGDTVGAVISKLNSAFATQGVNLSAQTVNGVLRVQATKYGDDISVRVISDQGEMVGTRMGGQLTSQGEDIAGTIGGELAVGAGDRLFIDDEDSEIYGLAVDYSGGLESVGGTEVGTISITTGANDIYKNILAGIFDENDETSLIEAKKASIASTISDLTDQAEKEQDRLDTFEASIRRDFVALEKSVAVFNAQGDFISSQITQLQNLAKLTKKR